MADLKRDLINKISNDKYYAEIELIRLAQDPTMNYEGKIYEIQSQLNKIAILNAQLGLAEQYFQIPQNAATGQQVGQQPVGNVHQGQSHGE